MGRSIKIWTGAAGMESFEEAFQESVGLKRMYLGNKVLRILRKTKGVINKSSYSGRYYRLFGLKKYYIELSDKLDRLKFE